MIRLIGLVVSIGLADSVNPSTIAPALFLASGEGARTRVTQFSLGVFGVYLLGGTIIALGPGQLLLALVPHPHHRVAYVIELGVGIAMVCGGVLLLRYRRQLSQRDIREPNPERKSSAILGATITAVELPTAFPYFAAIAAIVSSGLDPARQFALLVIFNACFVLPLIVIVATLAFAGDRAERILSSWREYLERNWPAVLATLALAAGAFVIALGATGLAGIGHGHVGRFARGLRRFLHP
jgi:cytochrome c biogenesis protein CcdA